MQLRLASCRWSLAAALLLANGCAATLPADVEQAKTLRISYFDFRTDRALVLVGRDDPDFKDRYSKAQGEANVKLADAEQLQRIVAAATEAGYFEYAVPIGGPEEVEAAKKFKLFVIHADGRPYSLLLAEGVGKANRDVIVAFNETAEAFFVEFNSINSLQWVDPEKAGENLFEQERERIRRENQQRQKSTGGGR